LRSTIPSRNQCLRPRAAGIRRDNASRTFLNQHKAPFLDQFWRNGKRKIGQILTELPKINGAGAHCGSGNSSLLQSIRIFFIFLPRVWQYYPFTFKA